MTEFELMPEDWYNGSPLINIFVDANGLLSEDELCQIEKLSLDEIGYGLSNLKNCKLNEIERKKLKQIEDHLMKTRFK